METQNEGPTPVGTPAQRLEGMVLEGGWRVTERLDLSQVTTGGWFSESYLVEDSSGHRGFLKAIDYVGAIASPDPVAALKALVDAYDFERELLRRCRTNRFDRVVVAIADGTLRIGTDPVSYLIFERADSDFRVFAERSQAFDLAWALRALHHVSNGLVQLHGESISHQDVKPSNVLVFADKSSKIADLGRAVSKGGLQPNEGYAVPCDKTYAPLELLYGFIDPDWNCRRLGADAYLLGSMVVFCFTGVGITRLIHAQLHADHRWGAWSGTYDDVLPYIREAFERCVEGIAQDVPVQVRPTIIGMIRQLCDPDPRSRGDMKEPRGTAAQYSLRRFMTTFDSLASKVERGIVLKAFSGGS